MPKIHNHEDVKINEEFDDVHGRLDRMYIISVQEPRKPVSGTMWFNPSDGTLKIFKNIQDGWGTITTIPTDESYWS